MDEVNYGIIPVELCLRYIRKVESGEKCSGAFILGIEEMGIFYDFRFLREYQDDSAIKTTVWLDKRIVVEALERNENCLKLKTARCMAGQVLILSAIGMILEASRGNAIGHKGVEMTKIKIQTGGELLEEIEALCDF